MRRKPGLELAVKRLRRGKLHVGCNGGGAWAGCDAASSKERPRLECGEGWDLGWLRRGFVRKKPRLVCGEGWGLGWLRCGFVRRKGRGSEFCESWDLGWLRGGFVGRKLRLGCERGL